MARTITSKRRFARLKERFAVEFSVDGSTLKGTAINLSEYGLFIKTKLLPAAHSRIELKFPISPEKIIELQGKVIWIRADEEEADEAEPLGMGVELLQPPIIYLSFVKELREKLATIQQVDPSVERTQFDLKFISPAEFLANYSESFCRGCAYLTSKKPLRDGEPVQLTMEVPGWNHSLMATGQAAYRLTAAQSEEIGRDSAEQNYFVDLDPGAAAQITHALRGFQLHEFDSKQHRPENLPSEGKLMDFLVPEILFSLHQLESTGTLDLERRGIKKRIYVRRGEPVFIESSLRWETLGNHLVRKGAISQEDLEISLQDYAKHDLHHGEIMIRGGMIDAPTLARFLVSHQEEKLSNTFSWFDGTFKFAPGTNWPSSISFFPLRPHSIVFAGIVDWYDVAVMKAWMGLDGGTMLRRVRMPTQSMDLPLSLIRVLNCLETQKDVQALSLETSIPIDEVMAVVFSLILADLVTTDQTKKIAKSAPQPEKTTVAKSSLEPLHERVRDDYERMHYLNFFEIFDLPPDPDEEALTAKFNELIKPYTDVQLTGIDDPELRDRVSQIYSWLRVGYHTLRDPEMRQIYAKRGRSRPTRENQMSQFDADRLFLASLRDLGKGAFDNAIERLSKAVRRYPDDVVFYGYLAWAIFQKDPKENRKRAVDLLDKAIANQSEDGQLYYFRGRIHEYLNEWREAEAAFARALKIQPSFYKAKVARDEVREKAIREKA